MGSKSQLRMSRQQNREKNGHGLQIVYLQDAFPENLGSKKAVVPESKRRVQQNDYMQRNELFC